MLPKQEEDTMVHPKTIPMVNLYPALLEITPDPELWVWDR